MEIINNTFRIIKTEYTNRYFNTYIVQNVSEKEKQERMYILNSETFPEEMLKFFIDEYFNCYNLKNPYIMNLSAFDMIYTIDMKPVERKTYFMLMEYETDTELFIDKISMEDSAKLLSYMIEILKIFDFTSRRNLKYPYIDGHTFYRTKQGNIKIKNTFLMHLEQLMENKSDRYNVLYLSPESFRGEFFDAGSEIYSIGVYLDNFFINRPFMQKYKKPLHRIIQKMKAYYKGQRYLQFYEVIEDINDALKENFPCVFEDQSMYMRMKNIAIEEEEISGRKKFTHIIIEEADAMKKGLKGISSYEITGAYGSGKTAFIMYISQVLSMHGMNIFSNFEKDLLNRNRSIKAIMIEIVDEKGADILNKYPKAKDFLKDDLNIENEAVTITQIGAFISEILWDEPTAFLIDDMKETDRISRGVIHYLRNLPTHIQRMIIIYSAEKPLKENETVSFIFDNLTLEGTAIFIQRMLSMHTLPLDFAVKVYEETYGNINAIKEIIFELHKQKMLYMDSSGVWHITVDDYNDLVFPDKKGNDLTEIFSNMNKNQVTIINSMSALKNSYSLWDIKKLCNLGLSQPEMEESLEDLIRLKLIGINHGDDGISYEFQDKLMKKKFYEQMDSQKRIDFHRRIAQHIQSKKYYQKDLRLLEELVYQLKSLGEYKKASIFANLLSKTLFRQNFKPEAVNAARDASEYAFLSKEKSRQMSAYIRLAKLLQTEYQLQESLKIYEQCKELAKEMGQVKTAINCLSEMSSINILLNDFKASMTHIHEMNEILSEKKYKYGELEYLYALGEHYIYADRMDELKSVITEMEKFLYDEPEAVKGKYFHIKAIYMDEIENLDEAEQCYLQCIRIFEEEKNYKWLCSSYNNVGIFYSESVKDNKKSMEFFTKLISTAEEHYLLNSKAVGYLNLAEAMVFDFMLRKAQDYFLMSLKEAVNIGRQNIIFYNYIFLADIMLATLDIASAREYLAKAENELLQYPFQGRVIYSYHKIKARFHLYNGDHRKTKEFLNKALKGPTKLELTEIRVMESLMNMMMNEDEDWSESLGIIIEQIKEMSFYALFIQKAIFMVCLTQNTKYESMIAELALWLRENTAFKEDSKENILLRVLEKYALGYEYDVDLTRVFDKEYDRSIFLYSSYLSFYYYLDRYDYFKAINGIINAYITIRNIIKSSNMELRFDNYLGKMMKVCIDILVYLAESHTIADIKTLRERICPDGKAIRNKSFYQIRFGDNRLLKMINENPVIRNIMMEGLQIHPQDIKMESLVSKLKYSNLKNIEQIALYIKNITWATGISILTKKNKEYESLLTIGSISDYKDIDMITGQSDIMEEMIVSSKYWQIKEQREFKKNIFEDKSFLSIPIFGNNNRQGERRNVRNVLGHLYLESELPLNNFTKESYEAMKHLITLMGIFLDNHNMSMKYMLDKLTGAYNRQYFDNYIKHELEECQRNNNQTFSLVIMDIDNFKAVNDTYGHSEGDIILKHFVNIVQENIRNYDMFARYGGEEFALVLKDMHSEEAVTVSERIRQAVEEQLLDPVGKPVTVSMGIASYREHGGWEEELIRRADMAMYASKSLGRNKVVLWNESIGDGKQLYIENLASGNLLSEDREAEKLFMNGLNILKMGRQDDVLFTYMNELLSYFKAEELFVIRYEQEKFTAIWRFNAKQMTQLKKLTPGLVNEVIIKRVIEENTPIFIIDWDHISGMDELTGAPDWDSIICTPMTLHGKVKGVTYLKAPFRTKEFSYHDSLIMQILSTIIGNLF